MCDICCDREEIKKQQYIALQDACKTDQARADLERLAIIKARRAEAEAKRKEEMDGKHRGFLKSFYLGCKYALYRSWRNILYFFISIDFFCCAAKEAAKKDAAPADAAAATKTKTGKKKSWYWISHGSSFLSPSSLSLIWKFSGYVCPVVSNDWFADTTDILLIYSCIQ